MTHAVTAANVANFVREFRLGLPVSKSIRSNGDSTGFFLRWREPRCRSAGRRIVDRVAGVIVYPSAILFWPGRFRSWMEEARLGGIVGYRHRYSRARSSSETEGHCRAARMRAATFRCALMLVLKHQQRKALESKNVRNLENLSTTRQDFMFFILSLSGHLEIDKTCTPFTQLFTPHTTLFLLVTVSRENTYLLCYDIKGNEKRRTITNSSEVQGQVTTWLFNNYYLSLLHTLRYVTWSNKCNKGTRNM